MRNVRYDNRRLYRDGQSGCSCAENSTARRIDEWKAESIGASDYRMPGTKTGTWRDGWDKADRCEMKEKLMALYFVVVELELYLDTHPDNCAALARYKCAVKEYEELAAVYEKKYGPLLARHNDCPNEWLWVREPWPWEV